MGRSCLLRIRDTACGSNRSFLRMTGTWYAYFHHERSADSCGRPDRQLPRIGALRSSDRGQTWDDLGIIIDAPPGTDACDSGNRFVLGGVGDVTAALDAESKDVYLYFSQYLRDPASQGVAVARLAWADRDQPAGKVTIWSDGAWLPDVSGTPLTRPPGTPSTIVPGPTTSSGARPFTGIPISSST